MSLLMIPRVGDGNGGGFDYLLDELIVEILSRLSAEQLWCRCCPVCKRWYSLISSPHFAHAHLQQSPHTSFVFNMLISRPIKLNEEYTFPCDDDSVFIRRGLVERWRRQMGDQPIAASCNGLVLFTRFSLSEFYIGNPVTKELISMTQTNKLLNVYTRKGYFCGFFHHTSTQEYKLLLCREINSTENPFEYAMLTLGLTEWRSLGALPYSVRLHDPWPTILDDTLYWMIDCWLSACENSILTFSIDSEEFRTMSHPSRPCQAGESHGRMSLLVVEDRLTCWWWCSEGVAGDLWAFEVTDGEKHTGNWVPIYHLDFIRILKDYPISISWPFSPIGPEARVVSIRNSEVLLVLQLRWVFRYNLLTNAVTGFKYSTGIEEIIRYTRSVVSLDNFYPGLSKIHTY